MKLCVNCMWRRDNYCRAPQNLETDLVTGQQLPKRWPQCISHRTDAGWLLSRLEGLCGREGRWFAPADAAVKGGAK